MSKRFGKSEASSPPLIQARGLDTSIVGFILLTYLNGYFPNFSQIFSNSVGLASEQTFGKSEAFHLHHNTRRWKLSNVNNLRGFRCFDSDTEKSWDVVKTLIVHALNFVCMRCSITLEQTEITCTYCQRILKLRQLYSRIFISNLSKLFTFKTNKGCIDAQTFFEIHVRNVHSFAKKSKQFQWYV